MAFSPRPVKHIAIQFARFGPYHIARIDSAAERLLEKGWKVTGLETASTDETYSWDQESHEIDWNWRTVFPSTPVERIPQSKIKTSFYVELDDLSPDAVAIAGWGFPDARACLSWCKRNRKTAILMSETRRSDGDRIWWKEWIKGRIVRQFDSALVGGSSHRDYLIQLGLAADQIALGYNVIGNDFFSSRARQFEHSFTPEKSRHLFLASNRFISRKNLPRLIRAFAQLSREHSASSWDLCLLGDGEQKNDLQKLCHAIELNVVESSPWETAPKSFRPTVFFPGFRQVDELPHFYACADCFIHPALAEPWGLVINEAMACGLPVLSSTNVGAAEELLDEGGNGWSFNPISIDSLAHSMKRIVKLTAEERQVMGVESRRILEDRCPTRAFGEGLAKCLEVARAL